MNSTTAKTNDEAGAFLGHWDGLKQTGPGKWMALCSGHDDKKPSLSITLEDSKFSIYCHAGCRTDDVLAAKGLAMADLFLNGDQPEPRKVVAVYKYLGFEVVKTDPKGFYQRRSDGKGGYSYNLDGVTRTLYHNNELPAAIEKGVTIWNLEGEKDTDRLRSLGLVATCNSGGAGKWKDSYTTALRGADLVIIPDNDPPGRDHAAKVAKACQGTARRVRILELPGLPDKGDVSDWLDAGGTAEQLRELAEACPTWTPAIVSNDVATPVKQAAPVSGFAIRCMKDIKPIQVKWLWWPYIPIGKITSLEGDPGIAKTYISLAIATALSLGKGLPGQVEGEPCRVMMASAEDGYADTFRPRLDAMGADHANIFVIDEPFSFDDEGFAKLEAGIIEIKPRLLVIDPLQAYMGADLDFHRANETRPVLARLAKLAEKYELAVLIIRHLSKGSSKAIYRGIGSIDFTAACRSVLMAGCDPDNPNNLAIVHIKSNLAKKGPSQGYELRDDNFYWTGESAMTADQIMAGDDNSGNRSEKDEAADFLRDELANGPVPANNVYRDAESAGISKRTLNRAKAQMGIITGRIHEKGKAGGGGYWTWQLPNDDLQCHGGNLSNEGVRNTYNATIISGNLSNSEANNLTLPKILATYVMPEMVPAVVEIRDKPSGKWQEVKPQDPPPDLVAPRESIIELWNSNGRPLVHLGPGENNEDLEKLLSHNDISARNLEAVNKWYTNNRSK